MRAVPLDRYLTFGSIAVLGLVADLATKHWAFSTAGMPGGPTRWLWQDVVGLQTSLNEGALFGLGQGFVTVFALLAAVALVAVLAWLFVAGAARDRLLNIALACVTAGILGNLYDRLGMPGLTWNYVNELHKIGEPVHAVRDWILVMIGPWHWPNFNIADSLLVCGAILLCWHALRYAPEPSEAEKPAAE
ncbi:MAG: signal peptidase II [Pirellulales bacterium]|nr:signal peptidase II [Pirellulales bacterium]